MDNPHAGHRERLRLQFLANGMEGMHQHQILEMLLFYAIPRVDTNVVAHRLIKRFGCVREVLDADINELMSVEGIGKNAAVFLKMLPQVFEVYQSSINDGMKLADMAAISTFVTNLYNKVDVEILRLICLDDDSSVRDNVVISRGGHDSVAANHRRIVQKILNSGCDNCILIHNHPNASSKPSREDISATKALANYLGNIGITLIDHLIIGDDGITGILSDCYI